MKLVNFFRAMNVASTLTQVLVIFVYGKVLKFVHSHFCFFDFSRFDLGFQCISIVNRKANSAI